jgi:hypothetical protein
MPVMEHTLLDPTVEAASERPLSIPEAGAWIGKHSGWIREKIAAGEIVASRAEREIRIFPSALRAYLEAHPYTGPLASLDPRPHWPKGYSPPGRPRTRKPRRPGHGDA